MRRLVQSLVIGFIVAYWLPTGVATAESTEEKLLEMNREAMDAYNNLDVSGAISILKNAIDTAKQAGIAGPLLAITYLNLGVVQIGGQGDDQQGFDSFVEAYCADPATQLDPLLGTPDIQARYQKAQQKAASDGCPPTPSAAPAAEGPVQPVQPVVEPGPDGESQILHQPSLPQTSQAPLPIYAELSDPDDDVEKVVLFYRGLGMDDYKSAEMIPFGSGYAYQISCHDVWEPRMLYYLQALDNDDQVIARAGTAQSPLEAPIVTTLQGPGAALPDKPTPGPCVDVECPPDVTGDECEKPLFHAIGEFCDSERDCQPGLMCDDGICNVPGGLETPDLVGPERPARTDPARGFIQIGMALGMTYVSAGMITDSDPPQGSGNIYVTDTAADNFGSLRRDTAWVADADSYERIPLSEGGLPNSSVFEQVFRRNPTDECPADGKISGPDLVFGNAGHSYYPTRYCGRVDTKGFAISPAMRVAIGYFVTPRLSLAAILRYQFDAGEGTLANILLGSRAEYLFLGSDAATGFRMSMFLGGTVGQIQAQPPARKSDQPTPYLISGMGGAHAGFNATYRFHRNFGFVLAPEFDLQFPNILVHIDTTLSAEAAF